MIGADVSLICLFGGIPQGLSPFVRCPEQPSFPGSGCHQAGRPLRARGSRDPRLLWSSFYMKEELPHQEKQTSMEKLGDCLQTWSRGIHPQGQRALTTGQGMGSSNSKFIH